MRIRAAGLAMAIALLASLVLAGTVAAAIRPTTFWLYMGMSCVGGRSSSHADVDIVWRRATGTLLVALTYHTGRSGYWEVCSNGAKPLKAGDVVKATVDGLRHKLLIPTLNLKLDASADRIYGRAPARATLRLGWDLNQEIPIEVGPDGRWSYSPLGVDITSGFHAYARWESGKGDTVTFENTAPF